MDNGSCRSMSEKPHRKRMVVFNVMKKQSIVGFSNSLDDSSSDKEFDNYSKN